MSFWSKFRVLRGAREPDAPEAVARLLLAAREDEALRKRLLFILRAPKLQRESLVNTALHEMALRGESKEDRRAFAALGTDEGARAALALLEG